jgi:hypothetical protein
MNKNTFFLMVALATLSNYGSSIFLFRPMHANAQEISAGAVVLSPKDEARVPTSDDPCSENRPCPKIYVKGRVAKGLFPYLAVAPLNAAPKIWIQPPIAAVKSDGSFTGLVYLGTDRVGAGEKFSIFVFAHRDKDKFREGDVLMSVPKDCVISDPVTVLRTR